MNSLLTTPGGGLGRISATSYWPGNMTEPGRRGKPRFTAWWRLARVLLNR